MITEDLYQILEIQPDASGQEIRRAYYRLAKLHHPDLNGGDPADSDRFLAIQQAYEVLRSSDRRAQYDEERAGGAAGPSPAGGDEPASREGRKPKGKEKAVAARPAGPTLAETRDARAGFMKAEDLIDRGDVDNAVRVMSAVVRTVPDEPEFMSLLGYALGLAGEKLHRARDLCRRALEAEPYNLEFKARLGYVYHRAGLQKTADEYFQSVLKTQPEHPIASVYITGGSKGKGGGLMGTLKGLFGR